MQSLKSSKIYVHIQVKAFYSLTESKMTREKIRLDNIKLGTRSLGLHIAYSPMVSAPSYKWEVANSEFDCVIEQEFTLLQKISSRVH